VHKAQGMTVHGGLAINFGRMFEAGQAYTALSRTTAIANVEIRNFNILNRGMRANQAVIDFYNSTFPPSVSLLGLSSDDEEPDPSNDAQNGMEQEVDDAHEDAVSEDAAASEDAAPAAPAPIDPRKQAAYGVLVSIGAFTPPIDTFLSSGVATTIVHTGIHPLDRPGGTIIDAHNRDVLRKSSFFSNLYTDQATTDDDADRLDDVRAIAVSAGEKVMNGTSPTGVPKLIKSLLEKAGMQCELGEYQFQKPVNGTRRKALLVTKIQIGSS